MDYIEYFFDIFEKFYNWFDFDYDIELFSLYSDDIKKNSQIYKKFDENNNGYVYQNTESFLNNFFNSFFKVILFSIEILLFITAKFIIKQT